MWYRKLQRVGVLVEVGVGKVVEKQRIVLQSVFISSSSSSTASSSYSPCWRGADKQQNNNRSFGLCHLSCSCRYLYGPRFIPLQKEKDKAGIGRSFSAGYVFF